MIEIHEQVYQDAVELVTNQYSERYPNRSLTSVGSLKEIRFRAAGRAEADMWRVVGERVAESDGGVGRVVQSAESPFSVGRPGTFMIAANPDLVTINGGPAKLLEIIKSEGIPAEPEVIEAVQQKAQSAKIVGNVEHVFRVGGRLLVITGVAIDATNIYMADDRVREVVKVTGGCGGAAAAVTAYNAVMAPTNSAGPTAWVGNALANIAVGFGGYYGGSQIPSVIYDVTIDLIPVSVPVE